MRWKADLARRPCPERPAQRARRGLRGEVVVLVNQEALGRGRRGRSPAPLGTGPGPTGHRDGGVPGLVEEGLIGSASLNFPCWKFASRPEVAYPRRGAAWARPTSGLRERGVGLSRRSRAAASPTRPPRTWWRWTKKQSGQGDGGAARAAQAPAGDGAGLGRRGQRVGDFVAADVLLRDLWFMMSFDECPGDDPI